MSQIDYFAALGNGRENNKRFTLNAGESVTCYFKASGNDSTTAKYYDLDSDAKRCGILVNKVASITHINGHELDAPLTLGQSNWNGWTVGIRWDKITVYADSDDTTFEVYAY